MKKNNTMIALVIIFILGFLLRVYKMYDLAVFLADQASDSTVVFHLIHGKMTLLGPITSVGGFYNGPIVYYLMAPFYFLFRADPISGTIFQTTLSLATIPLLYLVGKKILNERVGLLAAFLFAISPLMIDYSRAAFNSYPAVFFSTLILYIILLLKDSYSIKKTVLLGILAGFILQMHYFAVSFLLLLIIYPYFAKKKFPYLSYYFFLFSGFILGLSPFLLFELRHSFLNTKLFFSYFISEKESAKSLINIFKIWPEITAQLLLGNNYLAGLFGFVITVITVGYMIIKDRKIKKTLLPFITLFLIVFLIGILYGGKMQTHYVISFQTSLILLVALCIHYLLKETLLFIVVFCSALLIINIKFMNFDKPKHPLQDGLSITDFKKTSNIIHTDKKTTYNVAMHAQGDNRAMPLRYTLLLLNENPQSYEDYSSMDSLYVLVKKKEPLNSLKMWEYTSFGKSNVAQKWEINDEYFLYKLKKSL